MKFFQLSVMRSGGGDRRFDSGFGQNTANCATAHFLDAELGELANDSGQSEACENCYGPNLLPGSVSN